MLNPKVENSIRRILEYLNYEWEDYEGCFPEEQETHVCRDIEIVSEWLAAWTRPTEEEFREWEREQA